MRIAVVGPMPPHRGGIAAHTRGLDHALRDAGLRTEVIGFRRVYPRWLFPGRSEFVGGAGGHIGRDEGALALIDVLRPDTWLRANRILRGFAPDAVVVQWWHPVVAPALRLVLAGLRSAKIICVCHNLEPHDAVPGSRVLAAMVQGRFNGALCHSQWVAGHFVARQPGAAVECVPMPLLFEAAGADEGRIGEGPIGEGPVWRTERGGRLVVFIGLVRPYKGVDLLIEAWGRVKIPDGARLLLAGESYLGRGRLEELVAGCPRSESILIEDRYLGDEEFVRILAAADLVVLPYRRASQSGVVPMAVATETPILVSDAGGLGEQCAAVDSAEIFSAGDVDSLCRGLDRCFARMQSPPATALRQAQGPAGLKSRYRASWKRVVEALHRLIRRLD